MHRRMQLTVETSNLYYEWIIQQEHRPLSKLSSRVWNFRRSDYIPRGVSLLYTRLHLNLHGKNRWLVTITWLKTTASLTQAPVEHLLIWDRQQQESEATVRLRLESANEPIRQGANNGRVSIQDDWTLVGVDNEQSTIRGSLMQPMFKFKQCLLKGRWGFLKLVSLQCMNSFTTLQSISSTNIYWQLYGTHITSICYIAPPQYVT
jgi:hypothetical protein